MSSRDLDPDLDLPLLANAEFLRARHYVLKIKPNLDLKLVEGEAIIFFEDLR